MEVSIEEVKKFYDEATYRKLNDFVYQNRRVEYAFNTLKSILNYIHPQRILEIGCGIGSISWQLASQLPTTQVIAFDVSERSIDLASKLFVLPNLSFIRKDSVTDIAIDRKNKLDIIFLMDVYEHIPVDIRTVLHSFIKRSISENGFLFLSCPTPQHLLYLKRNIPSEIQPVDEDITLPVLKILSNDTLMKLIYYKEVSVWHAGDYFHTIFSNSLDMKQFSDFEFTYKSQAIGLKKEIIKRIKKKVGIVEENGSQNIMSRKILIKERLGIEVLKKIESAV